MAHTFHVLIVVLLSMKLKLRAPILQLMAKLKSLEHRGMPSFANTEWLTGTIFTSMFGLGFATSSTKLQLKNGANPRTKTFLAIGFNWIC